jgi:hypothetical protein
MRGEVNMTVKESRRYEMFVRVREFGEKYGHLFPASSVGGQAFAALAAATAELGTHAASKMFTAYEGTTAKAATRAALKEQLEAIYRTARAVAATTPGFDDRLHVPNRRADSAVLTVGRVYLREIEPLKDTFVAHGLPESFVADLKETVERFERAIRGREAGKNEQTAAQAGVDSAIAAGLAALRTLDVVVANQLRKDPAALAVWTRDRRLSPLRKRGAAGSTHPPAKAPAKSTSSPTAAGGNVPTPAAAPREEPASASAEEPVAASAADVPERVAS